jgi:hypothetical protein
LCNFKNWQELPAQAELHGMSALLWHHIGNAGIEIPQETARTLRGLYLRHRLNNQIHARVLLEVLSILQTRDIQPVVLKGLGLAYEYYPDPALRPMSDIDLLLKQADVLPALTLLADAGFEVELPSQNSRRLPKQLQAISPQLDGIFVTVELHHYDPQGRSLVDNSPDDEFIELDTPPHAVEIKDIGRFYVPDAIDTLYYLLRHIKQHLFWATAPLPLPLKWTADVISLVEHQANDIDWKKVKQGKNRLLNQLEIFYCLTPMPEHLKDIIPVQPIQPPSGINQYSEGWPQWVFPKDNQSKWMSYFTHLWNTFTHPSNWWLQLYYGIDSNSTFIYGQFVYRLQIIKMAFWKLSQK